MTRHHEPTDRQIHRSMSSAVTNHGDLAQAVAERLREHPMTRGKRITATVHGSLVVLVGDVTRPADRDAAQRAVYCVPGVQAVLNRLLVLPEREPRR